MKVLVFGVSLWSVFSIAQADGPADPVVPVSPVVAPITGSLAAPPPFPSRSELPPPEVMFYAYPSAGLSIDTSDREAVRLFYNGLYSPSDYVAINWTGNHSACNAGSTDQLYRNAVALRVNWFRALAGVPATVSLNSAYSQKDQQAALVMSANNNLSHTPPSSWNCWTQSAYDSAGKSNLSLGGFGPDAVTGYILDPGSSNAPVGHRRWVLYPQTKNMGTGDVPAGVYNGTSVMSANALWVVDSHTYDPRPAVRDDFVAWPPKGYVPYPVVFGRWSLSHANADFSAATVTVKKAGVIIPVSIEAQHNPAYGENTLVWLLQGMSDATMWSKPTADEPYQVTVANVKLNGVTRSFSYTVTVFDPATVTPDAPQTTAVPPVSASAHSTFSVSVLPMDKATSYQVALYRLSDSSPTVAPGTTPSPWAYVTGPTAAYNPIEASAFHLYHSDGVSKLLTLDKKLSIGPSASLSFLSWFTWATYGQIAKVQISLDDGISWQDVYAEAGSNNTSPATKSVDLSRFAGRFAKLRFAFFWDYTSGVGAYSDPTTGWYFNNITLTNISEMLDEQTVSVPVPSTVAGFTAGAMGHYVLAARTEYQGMYFGDWGPASVFAIDQGSIAFAQGWNLSGNGSNGAIDVATAFGEQSKVVTVWKWLPASNRWAFYTPSLSAPSLADYASSKNYAVLDTINAGEGFWLNAKTPFSVTTGSGTTVTAAQVAPTLTQGWNLVAVGDTPQTPAQMNAELGYGMTSLWAWDNALSNWYFYAPGLEQNGALKKYIDSRFFLDFTLKGKKLGWGTGFWVRKP